MLPRDERIFDGDVTLGASADEGLAGQEIKLLKEEAKAKPQGHVVILPRHNRRSQRARGCDTVADVERTDARNDGLRAVFDRVIVPLVARDEGVAEWVGVRDDVVEIRLGGACRGCPGQRYTVEMVILPALRAQDPALKEVRVLPMIAKPSRGRTKAP